MSLPPVGQAEGGRLTVRALQVLAGLLISALALFLALRDVHWHAVGAAAGAADYLLVGAAALLFVLTIAIRALRWRMLFRPLPGPRLWHLFGSLNVAYFINNILPFQMGDLGRAYLLSELEGVSATRSLSTVVVERILDVLTLLIFLLLLSPFVSVPSWARTPSMTLAAIFLALALALVAASLRRRPVLALLGWALALAPATSRPKLHQMGESALDGFAVLSRPGLAAALLGVSAINWLSAAAVVYLGTRAFHLGVGFDAAVFVLVATSFGFFVPSSPGSFGVYHAIAIGTLTSVFGVEKSAAVSYALIEHLVFYLPPIALGTGFLWLERGVWQRATLFGKLAELRGGTYGSNAAG